MLRGEVEDEKQKKIICRKENRFSFFFGSYRNVDKISSFFFFASYLILTIFAYNLFHCLKLTAKSFIIWLIDKQERERILEKKEEKKWWYAKGVSFCLNFYFTHTHSLFRLKFLPIFFNILFVLWFKKEFFFLG